MREKLVHLTITIRGIDDVSPAELDQVKGGIIGEVVRQMDLPTAQNFKDDFLIIKEFKL
jgi:hypothetical protein